MPDLAADLKIKGDHDPVEETLGKGELPSTCDVFDRKPDTLEALEERGYSTKIIKVCVYKLDGKHHNRIPGSFPPEVVNTEWLLESYGPGVYVCKGFNEDGIIVASGRVPLGFEVEESAIPGAMPRAVMKNGKQQQYVDPFQQLAFESLKENLSGKRDDPIREAMASMVSSMTAMMTLQMQRMELEMKMADRVAKPEREQQNSLMSLVTKLITQKQGAPNGSMQETLGLLQFGMQLARQVNPGAEPEKDPDWLKATTMVSETMGPGLVATLAQAMLPADKAKVVIEAIEEHEKTRQAEAAAQPIDTEGQSVP